jgi:hypothetical protein
MHILFLVRLSATEVAAAAAVPHLSQEGGRLVPVAAHVDLLNRVRDALLLKLQAQQKHPEATECRHVQQASVTGYDGACRALAESQSTYSGQDVAARLHILLGYI